MNRAYANSIDAYIPIIDLGSFVMCDLGINYWGWWKFASKRIINDYLSYVKEVI